MVSPTTIKIWKSTVTGLVNHIKGETLPAEERASGRTVTQTINEVRSETSIVALHQSIAILPVYFLKAWLNIQQEYRGVSVSVMFSERVSNG